MNFCELFSLVSHAKSNLLFQVFFPIKDRGKKFSSKKLSFSHSNINYVVGWCWRNEIGRGNLILILFKLVSSKMKWRVRQGKWRRSPSSFRDKWEFCLQIFFFFFNGGSLNIRHSSRWRAAPAFTWHPRRGCWCFSSEDTPNLKAASDHQSVVHLTLGREKMCLWSTWELTRLKQSFSSWTFASDLGCFLWTLLVHTAAEQHKGEVYFYKSWLGRILTLEIILRVI